MPPSTLKAAPSERAQPYGLLGLCVSTVAIALVAALLLVALAGIAFAILAARSGVHGAMKEFVELAPDGLPDTTLADRINVIVGALAYIVTAAAVALVARFRGGRNWTALVGWNSWVPTQHARQILALLAGTLAYSLLASSVIENFYPQAKDWVSTPTGTPWIVGFLALATLFAPITEELLFRGWIYTSLRGVIGVRFGIVVSALLFAIAHWEASHLYAVAVFPVGLALGYIRQRADSVAASITLHSLYNGVAAVLMFVVH